MKTARAEPYHPERQPRAEQAWAHAERLKRLSDRLVGVGPIGVGLDGVVAWIPGANAIYSVGVAGLLFYQAVQSGAAPKTLARMGAFLAVDSALSGVPVVGWAIDTFFPGHLMAAKTLQKDIERRFGRPVQAPGEAKRPRRFWGLSRPFGRA